MKRALSTARNAVVMTALGAALVVPGCLGTGSDLGDKEIKGSGDECVFAFDCRPSEICSDEGRCIYAPTSLDECMGYSANPGVVDAPDPEGGQWREGQLGDSEGNRLAYADLMLEGMDSVRVSDSHRADFEDWFSTSYRDLYFLADEDSEGNWEDTGPLHDALWEAWRDHQRLRSLLLDDETGETNQGAEALTRLRLFREIHQAKTTIREHLPGLEAGLWFIDAQRGTTSSDDGTGGTCEGILEEFLDPYYVDRVDSGDFFTAAIGTNARLCLDNSQDVLDAFEGLEVADLDGLEQIPVDQLQRTQSQILSYIRNDIRNQDYEDAFSDCASLVRSREYMYAVSLYGNSILDSSRTASNLFPITDIDVDFGVFYWGKPLGEAAGEATTAHEAREILAVALEGQNAYLVDLVRDHPTEPEELAQVAMLAERFLQENPAFEDIHAAIIQEQVGHDQVMMWAGVTAGFGCAGGTIAMTWVTGPWALVLATGAGIACAVDIAIMTNAVVRTTQLYYQALTFRYFATHDGLETYERITELKWEIGVQSTFLAVGVLAGAFDAIAVVREFRTALRVCKAGRGIRGYVIGAGRRASESAIAYADDVRRLSNSPGAASVLDIDGSEFRSTSGRAHGYSVSDDVQRVVDDIWENMDDVTKSRVSKRGGKSWHGSCGEPRAVSKALDEGVSEAALQSGHISTARVRRPGRMGHGDLVPPCPVCARLLEHYGIAH